MRHSLASAGELPINHRVLEMRADLMAALRDHIQKKGWTQSEAAKKLGITQPRISALMKGAWRDFSADMLLVLAARLGLLANAEIGRLTAFREAARTLGHEFHST
jgi:predicted XRE-type DNA-binding protein